MAPASAWAIHVNSVNHALMDDRPLTFSRGSRMQDPTPALVIDAPGSAEVNGGASQVAAAGSAPPPPLHETLLHLASLNFFLFFVVCSFCLLNWPEALCGT